MISNLDMNTLRMRGHLVLLRALSHDETADTREGLIYLPDIVRDRQKYRNWVVVTLGDRVREALEPGMRVIVDGRFAGEGLSTTEGLFRVVREDHIIATITEE